MYFSTYGSWPTGLTNFFPDGNKQHEAFLAGTPTATNDAWHHPIQYQPFDAARGYGRAISLGQDGKLGGLNADDIEIRFTTNEAKFVPGR